MARKKAKEAAEFVLFDVLYEDGTLTSNRRVPSSALGGLEGDAPAGAIIEMQDREIAERAGRLRSPIKSVSRVGRRKAAYGGPDKPVPTRPRRGSEGGGARSKCGLQNLRRLLRILARMAPVHHRGRRRARSHLPPLRRPSSRSHAMQRRSLRRLGGRSRRKDVLRHLQRPTQRMSRLPAGR